jgi:hypothetical protein
MRTTLVALQARVDQLLASVGAPCVSVVERSGAERAPLLVRGALLVDKRALFGLHKHAA